MQHGVHGGGQFGQLFRHLRHRQAGGQRAGRHAGRDLAHLPQWPQPPAYGPGAEQRSGQGREADGEPDQALHALQEMLMVGDVEVQRQLRGLWFGRVQRHCQAAVIGAVGMQGRKPRGGCGVGQLRAAVEPRRAVVTADAQGQVSLVAELIAQGREAGVQLGGGGDAGQLRAKQRQA
ncbi:hypothetical protein D3C81_1521260 [compost metagenome]